MKRIRNQQNHKFSLTGIVLRDIALTVVAAALVYLCANGILKQCLLHHVEDPDVFRRQSDICFASLQEFVTENELSSHDGQALTKWNDKYYYVSMLIKDPDKLCFNSFVSYHMYYDEAEGNEDDDFLWGSKTLPVHYYKLTFTDETADVIFSGYFDVAYEPLRKAISSGLFVLAFVLVFFHFFIGISVTSKKSKTV